MREADNDLPRRAEARTQAIHQLDDLARRLGLVDHEALLAAPPSDAEIAQARRALDARRDAARRRDEARARAQEAERKCADLDRAAAPGPVVDPEPLRRRLDALAERIADADRLAPRSAALDRQARELAEFAARLDPPVPDPEALARAPLPAAAEVAAFAKADQARAQAGEIAARELQKAERSLEAAEAALKAREREAAGATRADWLAAREARDRGLDRLGGALADDARVRGESYEQARALVLAADAVADRYVEDVERATRLEAAREDCAARRADLARAQSQTERHVAEMEAAQAEWLKMWTRSGFAPRAPAAMTRWLDQAEALLKRRAELASRRDEARGPARPRRRGRGEPCRGLSPPRPVSRPPIARRGPNWRGGRPRSKRPPRRRGRARKPPRRPRKRRPNWSAARPNSPRSPPAGVRRCARCGCPRQRRSRRAKPRSPPGRPSPRRAL